MSLRVYSAFASWCAQYPPSWRLVSNPRKHRGCLGRLNALKLIPGLPGITGLGPPVELFEVLQHVAVGEARPFERIDEAAVPAVTRAQNREPVCAIDSRQIADRND